MRENHAKCWQGAIYFLEIHRKLDVASPMLGILSMGDKLQLSMGAIATAFLCAVASEFFVAMAADTPSTTQSKKTEAIPWDQIGAKAGADYHGDRLSVAATEAGARLHCVFQRLDGEATSEGLWLVSTVTNSPGDPSAVAVPRKVDRKALQL